MHVSDGALEELLLRGTVEVVRKRNRHVHRQREDTVETTGLRVIPREPLFPPRAETRVHLERLWCRSVGRWNQDAGLRLPLREPERALRFFRSV